MSMASRREALRRLGHPRFRATCQSCKNYVPAVSGAYVWDDGAPNGVRRVEVCASCKKKIHEQNEQGVRRRVDNELALEQANRDHFDSAQRGSDPNYLAACERMRREMGLG